MNLGELFDGHIHYCDPDTDFQTAWQESIQFVPLAIQSDDIDPLETPIIRMVSKESNPQVKDSWGVEGGWSIFCTLARDLGVELGGRVEAVQLNHRAAKATEGSVRDRQTADGIAEFGPPEEKEYVLTYKPGHGWSGVL